MPCRCCLARREINLILCGGGARERTGDTDHPIPIAVVAFQHRMNYTAVDSDTTEAEDSLHQVFE